MKRVTASIVLLSCAAFVVSAGCGTACRCRNSESALIASAPERVQIEGREFSLSVSAWRDFQPVAPPNGQPLIVMIKVSAADASSLPADLLLDQVWVLNGKEQWSVKPESSSPSEAAIRGGPKWGPGIKVDVVARLRQGKQTFLVRAAGVDIKRTD